VSSTGVLPKTSWGSLQRSPDPLAGLWGHFVERKEQEGEDRGTQRRETRGGMEGEWRKQNNGRGEIRQERGSGKGRRGEGVGVPTHIFRN